MADVGNDDIDSGVIGGSDCDKNPQSKGFSRQQLKKVMKKIKGFLNPMVRSLSKDTKDKEEKISLTYNSKRGCLIQLEKKNGKIETLVDYFNSQNDVESSAKSVNHEKQGQHL